MVAKHVRRWARAVRLDATGRFECPRHAGALTLSPNTCARLYRRGLDAVRGGDVADQIPVAPCIDCPIGATHAGGDPASTRQPSPTPPRARNAPPEVRRRRSAAGWSVSREQPIRKARA